MKIGVSITIRIRYNWVRIKPSELGCTVKSTSNVLFSSALDSGAIVKKKKRIKTAYAFRKQIIKLNKIKKK